jgi:hypothetical protein
MMPDYSLNPMAMDDGFALRLANQTISEQRAEIEQLRLLLKRWVVTYEHEGEGHDLLEESLRVLERK